MPHFVTLCPKCGGDRYHRENENAYTGDQGFYVCNNCGHQAKIFPEVEVGKKEEFAQETSHRKKEEEPTFSVSRAGSGILVLVASFLLFLVVGWFALLLLVCYAAYRLGKWLLGK